MSAPAPARRTSARVAAARARPPPPSWASAVPTATKRAKLAATGAAPPTWAVRNVVCVGGDGEKAPRAPATVFLGGDGMTLSAVPAAAAGNPDDGRRQLFFAMKQAQMRRVVEGFHEYWVGSMAAKDGAATQGLRPYRHVGRVKVKGAWLGNKAVAEGLFFVKREELGGGAQALDSGIVNLWSVLRKGGLSSVVKGEEGNQLLAALEVLTDVGSSPWPSQLGVALASRRSLGKVIGKKNAADIEVEVYLGRMLFEVIAFPKLICLFKALKVEVDELPKFKEEFGEKFGKSPAHVGLHEYSFEGLLRRAEHTGYRRMDEEVDKKVHAGLTVKLLPFQRDTVQFMVDRATDRYGLNDYFWRKFPYTSGGDGKQSASENKQADTGTGERNGPGFYFFPLAGEVRLREPPKIRGAAICEEMGLGKTIECVATVLALQVEHKPFEFNISYGDVDCPMKANGVVSGRKQRLQNTDSVNSSLSRREGVLRFGDIVSGVDFDLGIEIPLSTPLTVRRWPAKATLVVLPLSLLHQWKDEVQSKAPSLKLHVWNPNLPDKSDESVAVGESACDIVLATYDHLQRDRLLSLIHWKCLVLDEAQVIRRSMTSLAKYCLNMHCESRFLMTGTPLVSGITDLSGELAFLRVWPFTLSNDGFFERLIEGPWQSRSSHALLDTLVRATMMRHSKLQPGIDLALPERSYRTIRVEMAPGGSSQAVYSFIRACAEDELERAATERQPQLRALRSLFNLLRMSCVSSAMVNTFALDFARRVVWASRMLRGMDAASNRLDSVLSNMSTEEIGKNIRVVSAESALAFVGSVNNGNIVRETRRSYAVGIDHGANANAVPDPLSPFKEMTDDELRAEAVKKELLANDSVGNVTRRRLIGLLGGGIHKLETDSVEDMRRDVLAFHLLPEADVKSAPKGRLLTLLRNHVQLSTGIDVSGTVHQSGFQTLAKLSETGEVPDCPVCLDSCTRPCVASCAHFYCHECIVALIGSYRGRARCALCRRSVEPNAVVEIHKSSIGRKKKSNGDNDQYRDAVIESDSGEDDDYESGAKGTDVEMSEDSINRVEAGRTTYNGSVDGITSRRRGRCVSPQLTSVDVDENGEGEDSSDSGDLHFEDFRAEGNISGPGSQQTGVTAASLWAEYDAFDDAGPEFSGLGFVPHTPSLNVRFLRHLAAAQREPAKFHALLEFINAQDGDAKFVVVAEAAGTLQACGRWLADQGIQSVGVGMERSSHRTRLNSEATHEFRTDPAKRVFMLNTASAAGLTLTDASFVIFLEPLIRRADELQAASRVHRIGQTKNVQIVRMVTVNSVEEDLIAARGSRSSTDSDEAAALSSAPLTQVTDSMLLDLFGWERLASTGMIRRQAPVPS